MDRLRLVKDARKPVAELVAAGWTLSRGGKHPKLTCPAGRHSIPIPTTGRGGKVLTAMRSEVRRHDRTCPEMTPL